MKRVVAQFRSPWRPRRALLAAMALLSVLTLIAAGAVVWQQQRVVALRAHVAELIEADRGGAVPPAPRPTPPYDASARQFLTERSAGWAPMLRTLESGAMIGVTPSAVEFNAADGVARVTLDYSDPSVLIDYLTRINEGVSSGDGLPRWTLVETRMQPAAPPSPLSGGTGSNQASAAHSTATIRSVW
jgi:hypothetical protein